MRVEVVWGKDVSERFDGLSLASATIEDIGDARLDELARIRNEVYSWVRENLSLDDLKNHPIVRAYRDFSWRLGIDPTKKRPSGEALARRVLQGKDIPSISPVVDAYNLASLRTLISISGFDLDSIRPPLAVRMARKGERFIAIGRGELELTGEEIVVVDAHDRPISIYMYRDSEEAKITDGTKNVLLLGYGVPRIDPEIVRDAICLAQEYIVRVCGGIEGDVCIYPL